MKYGGIYTNFETVPEKVIKSYHKLRKSFESLREAIFMVETPLEIDGTLQRFEYTFDTFWKFLKILLEYHGFECRTPRSCIKTAFRVGFLGEEEIFLDMLEDRNLTSHIYSEEESRKVFERIKNLYTRVLEEFIKNIQNSF